jgi:hypothetical protein
MGAAPVSGLLHESVRDLEDEESEEGSRGGLVAQIGNDRCDIPTSQAQLREVHNRLLGPMVMPRPEGVAELGPGEVGGVAVPRSREGPQVGQETHPLIDELARAPEKSISLCCRDDVLRCRRQGGQPEPEPIESRGF